MKRCSPPLALWTRRVGPVGDGAVPAAALHASSRSSNLAASRRPEGTFHFPLAVKAGRAVRQRVETSQRDLPLAHFADAVRTLFQASEGPFDLDQLPGLQFHQLGRDLLAVGVKSSIGAIAGLVGSERYAAFLRPTDYYPRGTV